MYVRLKHTLSALALEAVRRPVRSVSRAAVGWLLAFCDLASEKGAAEKGTGEKSADAAFDLPISAVAARARWRGDGGTGGLKWVLQSGLLEEQNGTLSLPADFRPHFSYMHRQVHRLASALLAVAARPGLRGKRAIIHKGTALFNAGLFFECHEFFEDVWRAAPPPARAFYQGVILVAAAFYHHEKGNLHGARIKLAQGIKRFEPYLPAAHGVRLDRWLAALAPWRSRIEAGLVTGVLTPSEIPRIPLARDGGS